MVEERDDDPVVKAIREADASDPFVKVIRDAQEKREKRMREHEQLRASPAFVAETRRLEKLTADFASTLHGCFAMATRHYEFLEKSFFLRHVEDLVQSALLTAFAVREGFLNGGKRELRFLLELAVQSLFTDEQMGMDTFDARFAFFRKKVKNNSVDNVRDLRLGLLDDAADDFRKHVVQTWAAASSYVHPTAHQLGERISLAERGVTIGFESVDQLRDTVDAVERALAVGVVLAFEAIGHSATGDLMVDGVDADDSWSFHRDRFVAAIDARYDYKHERQAALAEIRERRAKRLKA